MLKLLTLTLLLFPTSVVATTITGEPFDLHLGLRTFHPFMSQLTYIDITVDAMLTVVPATGQFFDPGGNFYWHSALMVTNITGDVTVDCLGKQGCTDGTFALGLLPVPIGDGSWVLSNSALEFLMLSVGDSGTAGMLNDRAYQLFTVNGFQVPVSGGLSTIASVPEPSPLTLLSIGAFGVILFRRGTSSRRRMISIRKP